MNIFINTMCELPKSNFDFYVNIKEVIEYQQNQINTIRDRLVFFNIDISIIENKDCHYLKVDDNSYISKEVSYYLTEIRKENQRLKKIGLYNSFYKHYLIIAKNNIVLIYHLKRLLTKLECAAE